MSERAMKVDQIHNNNKKHHVKMTHFIPWEKMTLQSQVNGHFWWPSHHGYTVWLDLFPFPPHDVHPLKRRGRHSVFRSSL